MHISHVYHTYVPQKKTKKQNHKYGAVRKIKDKPLWFTKSKTKGFYIQANNRKTPAVCI